MRIPHLLSILLAGTSAVVVGAMPSPAAAQASGQRSYNIPAQPLASALTTFAEQTDIDVVFAPDTVRNKRGNALNGHYTQDAALARLLAGSGLRYRRGPSGNLIVERAMEDAGQDSLPGEASAASATAENTGADIIVTAQRRAETVQSIPLSITAIGNQEIMRRGLVDQSDYLRTVPGVNLVDTGPGQNTLIIRGAFGEAFNTGPTVGVYFGDIPLTGFALGGSADVALVDVERIEVLRGPQGTLYGSNSLSGTVRYIPTAPDLDTFKGALEGGYSSTARFGGSNYEAKAIVNLPLVNDRLALRAVAYRFEDTGYYRNVAGDDPVLQAAAANFGAGALAINKKHAAGKTITGVRATLRWKPLDELDISASYIKQKTSQEDRPFEQIQYGKYRYSDYQFGGPGAGRDALDVDLEIFNVTAELNLDKISLVSSSSWINQTWTRIWDIGSLYPNRPPITQLSIADTDAFAQEVRAVTNFEGPFSAVVGLYYEDGSTPYRQPTYYVGDPASNPASAMQWWDSFADRQVKQKALFGEFGFNVTEALKLKAGGRLFHYDSRFIRRNFNSVVIPNSSSDVSTDESGHTLTAGVEYKPGRNALVYAKWGQGFRLGRPIATAAITSQCDLDNDGFIDGFNIRADLDRVSSDSIESYELGGKFTLLGGRATFNAAAYQNNWSDIPVNVALQPTCLTSITVNGGKARARGFELEGRIDLVDGLRIDAGLAFVDSVLTATTSAGNDGDRMNFTPKWNGRLGGEYSFAVGENDAFVRADYSYYGSYYTGTGKRGDRIPGYGLVNVATGIRVEDFGAQFYVNNLFNSDAFTVIGGPTSAFPAKSAMRVRPRTVGIRLTHDF